jgi:hypothetical protein
MTQITPTTPRSLGEITAIEKAFSRLIGIMIAAHLLAGIFTIGISLFLLYHFTVQDVPAVIRGIWHPNGLILTLGIAMFALIWLSPFIRKRFNTLAPVHKSIWAFEKAQWEYENWREKRGGSLETALSKLDMAGQWLEDVPEYKELRNQVLAAYKAGGGTDG